jgi:hypothetical protein
MTRSSATLAACAGLLVLVTRRGGEVGSGGGPQRLAPAQHARPRALRPPRTQPRGWCRACTARSRSRSTLV